jgi:hypothetical protein
MVQPPDHPRALAAAGIVAAVGALAMLALLSID